MKVWLVSHTASLKYGNEANLFIINALKNKAARLLGR